MKRSSFILKTEVNRTLSGISYAFAKLSPIQGQVTHALLTRAPLYYLLQAEEFSYDLHVLSTPPAFVLSQDQTRRYKASTLTRALIPSRVDDPSQSVSCPHASTLFSCQGSPS